MKSPSVATTLVGLMSLLSTSPAFAKADLDFSKELNCTTKQGQKLSMNDAIVGGTGKAVHSDNPRRDLRVTMLGSDRDVVKLMVDPGLRAINPDFIVYIDKRNAEITERREGSETSRYIYVPAQLETKSFWEGAKLMEAKCIQPLD
jgi:hypothetical protein